VDPLVRAKALNAAGMVAGVQNKVEEAVRYSEEALELFRSVGDEEGIAWSLTTLVVGPLERGDAEAAEPMLAEADALLRRQGHGGGIRRLLHLRGQHAALTGDLARAAELLCESGELSEAEGDEFSAASSFHSLGDIELARGDAAAARRVYARSLEICSRGSADRLVCYCVAGLAAVAAEQGEAGRAARLWGFAEAFEARLGFTMRWRTLYEERLDGVERREPEAYDAGRSLEVTDAVDLALEGA
jgi:hypothetical protein